MGLAVTAEVGCILGAIAARNISLATLVAQVLAVVFWVAAAVVLVVGALLELVWPVGALVATMNTPAILTISSMATRTVTSIMTATTTTMTISHHTNLTILTKMGVVVVVLEALIMPLPKTFHLVTTVLTVTKETFLAAILEDTMTTIMATAVVALGEEEAEVVSMKAATAATTTVGLLIMEIMEKDQQLMILPILITNPITIPTMAVPHLVV